MSASLFVRGLRRYGFSNPPEAVTRLLDGRHHLERFAMEQAGEVDYLITWRDNEFVGRVSLTPCRRAGANDLRIHDLDAPQRDPGDTWHSGAVFQPRNVVCDRRWFVRPPLA